MVHHGLVLLGETVSAVGAHARVGHVILADEHVERIEEVVRVAVSGTEY